MAERTDERGGGTCEELMLMNGVARELSAACPADVMRRPAIIRGNISMKPNVVFVWTTHSFESDFHAYDILHGGFGTRPDGTTACSKPAVNNGD